MERTMKVGICNGCISSLHAERFDISPPSPPPSSPLVTRTILEEEAKHIAILDQATKDRPLRNGKPLPMNRLLGGYVRREYPLGGRMAVKSTMDDDADVRNARTYNENVYGSSKTTIGRGVQYVSCVQRKNTYSLTGSNTKGKSSSK